MLDFLRGSGHVCDSGRTHKGGEQWVADALSRNNLSLAQFVLQDVAAVLERVPQTLVELMTAPMLGWSEQ